MTIQSTDTTTFELVAGSEKIGSIKYIGPFSYKATLLIGKDRYEILPIGVFSTKVSVINESLEVAMMQMNWKGHIIISVPGDRDYLLRAAGFFANKYLLENEDGEPVLSLDADFNWSKFRYNYHVSVDSKKRDPFLVLLATYAANYYISAMSAGM